MQLAVHQDDADILLKERNQLDQAILDKYRTAGQITQTGLKYIISLINDSYHLGKVSQPYTCQELCVLGDSYLLKLLSKVYNNGVREKGISTPVSFELNDITSGFSPELDDDAKFIFKAGDIVTISFGVHIDGYTANVSHTVVIYPPGVQGDNGIGPEGPLLGAKADAICASHIATETIVALLGLALAPEKLPEQLKYGNQISGKQIRALVDSVAESFNCVVIPGSKVRRIRRFLAGQAEGIVAETDFKGVVWDESSQESNLLNKSNEITKKELVLHDSSLPKPASKNSAIPSDEFVVVPGEVYQIDIKMASLSDFNEVGIVTLEEVDQFTGKNNKSEFNTKSTIHIRDFAINHQLKLKTSRRLLGQVDKEFSVYPFKLSYTSSNFPIDANEDLGNQVEAITKDLKSNRLGLAELANRHLINSRPIQTAKFIPLEKILNAANPTGKHGIDANKPVLPGMELPLPNLGISSLKLKSLLKFGKPIAVARELTAVVINNIDQDVIRLTGGSKTSAPSWVHSNFKLSGEYLDSINQLVQLTQDKRFGIQIRECQPFKNVNSATTAKTSETMQLD